MFQPRKLLSIFALFTALGFLPCSAAIAFDTSTEGGSTTATSMSWTHTMGAKGLIVACFWGDINTGNDDITSVTYNSVSMTLVGKQTTGGFSGVGTSRFTYMYMLTSAPSGAHTLQINATNSHLLSAVSASYTGTSIAQPDASGVTVGTTTSTASSLTTVINNSWLIVCANGTLIGADSGVTLRREETVNNGPGILDSNGPISPGGTNYTFSAHESGCFNCPFLSYIKMSAAPPSGCSIKVVNPVIGALDCIGAGSSCGKLVPNPFSPVNSPDCVGTGTACGVIVINPYSGKQDCTGL